MHRRITHRGAVFEVPVVRSQLQNGLGNRRLAFLALALRFGNQRGDAGGRGEGIRWLGGRLRGSLRRGLRQRASTATRVRARPMMPIVALIVLFQGVRIKPPGDLRLNLAFAWSRRQSYYNAAYESVNNAALGWPTARGAAAVGSLKSAVQDQLAISGKSSKFSRMYERCS